MKGVGATAPRFSLLASVQLIFGPSTRGSRHSGRARSLWSASERLFNGMRPVTWGLVARLISKTAVSARSLHLAITEFDRPGYVNCPRTSFPLSTGRPPPLLLAFKMAWPTYRRTRHRLAHPIRTTSGTVSRRHKDPKRLNRPTDCRLITSTRSRTTAAHSPGGLYSARLFDHIDQAANSDRRAR